MFRNTILALAFLVAGSVASHAQDSAPRYDGAVILTNLAGPGCVAIDAAVGAAFPAVLRTKVGAVVIPEAMTIEIPRGALLFIALGDGTFKGANQTASGNLIADATRATLPNSTMNLTTVPANFAPGTLQIDISGTASNFGAPGCTVTVRAAFARRP